MNDEIKELYDLFSIETVENVLTEMKEMAMLGYPNPTQIKLEEYLSERRSKGLI